MLAVVMLQSLVPLSPLVTLDKNFSALWVLFPNISKLSDVLVVSRTRAGCSVFSAGDRPPTYLLYSSDRGGGEGRGGGAQAQAEL